MPLINPRYQSVMANTTLYGVIACLKISNDIFIDINKEVKVLVDETYGVFFKLYDNMTQIRKECDVCEDSLRDMEMKLIAAKTDLRFDRQTVEMMQGSCFQLRESFDSLYASNERIADEGALFKRNLNRMSNKFRTGRTYYWGRYGLVGAFVGGALTGSNTDSLLVFGLGSLVGVGFAALGMYCTSFKKTCVLITLKRLREDTLHLGNKADEARDDLSQLVSHMSEQLEFANSNVRVAERATGIRVKKQADEMLKNIEKAKGSLTGVKTAAKKNATDLRSIMDLEHVTDLISL